MTTALCFEHLEKKNRLKFIGVTISTLQFQINHQINLFGFKIACKFSLYLQEMIPYNAESAGVTKLIKSMITKLKRNKTDHD